VAVADQIAIQLAQMVDQVVVLTDPQVVDLLEAQEIRHRFLLHKVIQVVHLVLHRAVAAAVHRLMVVQVLLGLLIQEAQAVADHLHHIQDLQ
jgi:hypothetical protein